MFTNDIAEKTLLSLLSSTQAGQMALTWVFMWCAFQFGVTTVFGLITDSIQAAFYIGPILLICIPGLILYAPSQKPNNPGFRDAFHVLLQKKHKRRFNPNTGAPRESRMKFLWKNKTRIGHGLITDLLLLGMVRPARGPIFVRCAVVHLLFDLCLELLAASWFILRLFSVSIILSLCGGVKACAMQVGVCCSNGGVLQVGDLEFQIRVRGPIRLIFCFVPRRTTASCNGNASLAWTTRPSTRRTFRR